MVHADASNFANGVTKKEAYEQVMFMAEGLMYDQRNWVCNLSNVASLLWHAYHSMGGPSNQVNWAGFYVLDKSTSRPDTPPATPPNGPTKLPGDIDAHLPVHNPTITKPQQLILGPFQGKVACQTILFGKGVCGTAAATQETQVVEDVHFFPGHIACDGASRSEIVVPVLVEDLEVQGGEDGGAEIKKKMKCVAIIDIDCAVVGGFDEVDRKFLEDLADVLAKGCDW